MSPLYRVKFNYGATHTLYFVTDAPDLLPAKLFPDEGMRKAVEATGGFKIDRVNELPKSTTLSFPHPKGFPAGGKAAGEDTKKVDADDGAFPERDRTPKGDM